MKKVYFLLAILMLTGASMFAQNVELSNSLIKRYETYKQKALSKDATLHDHLWLSPLINEAVINWKDLTDEAKDIFKTYKSRPTFTGTEHIATIGNFAFHYTTDGTSGENVDPTDNNGNGIPDYVENMALTFENDVSDLYHTTDGYTVPPNDADEVNGAYYDVYISGTVAGNGTYGYVQPETEVGDNPNSSGLVENDAYTSFMVMRNNYVGYGDDVTIAMEVTTAHEYMHAVQNGYSVSMEAWFKEASATWAEDYVFPGHDDNFQYLTEVFGSPDVALNIANGDAGGAFDGHWYGSWIFVRYMTEHTGDNIIKSIYERCISQYVINAIDTELTENWITDLDEMFFDFVVANVLMTNNSSFAPYTYSRANDYDTYINNNGGFSFENGSTPLNYTGTDIDWDSQIDGNDRLMRLGADYFTLEANQNFKITFSPVPANDETGLILLKATATSMSIDVADSNGEINVIDQADWDLFVPIVLRFDKTVSNTDAFDYTLTISEANVGITDISGEFSIYPNPAHNVVNVNTSYSQLKIKITDVTGKCIINSELGDDNKINTSTLSKGIYFMSIIKDNKILKTEKLIIN